MNSLNFRPSERNVHKEAKIQGGAEPTDAIQI